MGSAMHVRARLLGLAVFLAVGLPENGMADAFSPWSWGQGWPGYSSTLPGMSPWSGLSGWPSVWSMTPGAGSWPGQSGWSTWNGVPLWGQQPWTGGVPVRSGTFTGLDRWVVTPNTFRYVRPPQAGGPHGWLHVEVDPTGDFHVQMEVRGNARAMMNAMSALSYPGYASGW